MTMPYVYFVSFSHMNPARGMGFGSQSVAYDRPVSRFADVEVLTQKVHERMAVDGHPLQRGSDMDATANQVLAIAWKEGN